METAMPCKSRKTSGNISLKAPKDSKDRDCDDHWQRETISTDHTKDKTVYASTAKIRSWLESAKQTENKDHEDHLAERGLSMNHTILYKRSFSCFKQCAFQMQRPQWTKSGTSWRVYKRGKNQSSKAHKTWSMKQEERAKQFICDFYGCMPSQKRRIGRTIPKKTKDVLSYVDMSRKMFLTRMQCFPYKGLPRHTSQPPKLWMSISDFSDAEVKQLMQYRLTQTRQRWWNY